MPNLHEFQAKKIMHNYELPVGEGYVIHHDSKNLDKEIEEILYHILEERNEQVVVKAQVHAGGRGKAGGVKLFKKDKIKDAYNFAKKLIGANLVTHQTDSSGQFISSIYFEVACSIKKELYLSFILNRSSNSITIISSTEGGIDIEEVADQSPEKIYTFDINPIASYQSYNSVDLCKALNLDLKKYFTQFDDMMKKLYKMFIEKDLSMLEINPLVITEEDTIRILDAKVSVDDNAKFRQKDVVDMRDKTQEHYLETKALDSNLSYIKLEGNIGCMVNGAGLAMKAMDIIKYYGAKDGIAPANFLDVGGGADKDGVKVALDIIFSDKSINVVLINIFGGIVRCDMIAEAAISAIEEIKSEGRKILPIVIRLAGTNSEIGMKMINDKFLNNDEIIMKTANTLDEAALRVGRNISCLANK